MEKGVWKLIEFNTGKPDCAIFNLERDERRTIPGSNER